MSESAKVNGKKLMINEEFDRDLVELKERINMVMKLLQEEHQRYGQNLKKKVKWSIEQLYVRKLRQSLKHILDAWIREE